MSLKLPKISPGAKNTRMNSGQENKTSWYDNSTQIRMNAVRLFDCSELSVLVSELTKFFSHKRAHWDWKPSARKGVLRMMLHINVNKGIQCVHYVLTEARLRPGWGQAEARLRPGWDQAETRLRPGWGQAEARLRPGWGQAETRLRPGRVFWQSVASALAWMTFRCLVTAIVQCA